MDVSGSSVSTLWPLTFQALGSFVISTFVHRSSIITFSLVGSSLMSDLVNICVIRAVVLVRAIIFEVGVALGPM